MHLFSEQNNLSTPSAVVNQGLAPEPNAEKTSNAQEIIAYLNKISSLTKKIQAFMADKKSWYVFNQDTQVFSWPDSVARLSALIEPEIDENTIQQIQQIIEACFDQQAQLRSQKNAFVKALLEIDAQLILWSEGDPTWQNTKAEKTGLASLINRRFFAESEKTKILPDLIKMLVDETTQRPEHSDNENKPRVTQVVIIDDKAKNLICDETLVVQAKAAEFDLLTFQIDLNDPSKNCQACLEYLQRLPGEIRLIVDMDGVLIDTNTVLREKAALAVARFLTKRKHNK